MRPALRKETALSPTPSPTPAGWSWASYSFPAWNAGWMAAGRLSPAMPSSAEQPNPLETERSGRFPLEWYPARYSRHIPPGSPAGGLWPGLPAGGRLGDRLLHPHGKYCRAFANVRISTDFGGILTVEAKYYYEYIKQFISRRSPQQTQRCAQHSRKKHGAYGRQRCAAHLTPDGACKRCGTATFVRRCTTRSRSRRPAPTACGNLRTRWPASWKARKNIPQG